MLLHPIPGSLVWPAAMIVWGPGFISASHRHHCVQLVMAMQGTLRVRRGPADEWKSCGAALVRPDAFHEVDAREGTVLIGFVDAESELGAALRERMRCDIVCLGARQVARWREALKPPLSEAQVERWVKSQLLHRRRAVRIHPRVNRVLRYLRESLPVAEDFSLGKLAEISGLSRSRLVHVFTESVGVPIRPYLLWLRLQRAACDLMAGASVTAAAQNAGFSDAAHLTRTFRRMLGTTPSDLALRRRASGGLSMQSVVLKELAELPRLRRPVLARRDLLFFSRRDREVLRSRGMLHDESIRIDSLGTPGPRDDHRGVLAQGLSDRRTCQRREHECSGEPT